MTQEEIIKMAKAAGAANFYPKTQTVKADNYLVGQEFLERFAKLVAAKEREHYDELFEQIKGWCKDYPIAVFPEPDFGKAHEVLKANGMTLDAISASNMKHVITQVQKMIDAAIRARGEA